jgi:hypothetical protein
MLASPIRTTSKSSFAHAGKRHFEACIGGIEPLKPSGDFTGSKWAGGDESIDESFGG